MKNTRLPFFVTNRGPSLGYGRLESTMKLITVAVLLAVTSGCSSFLSVGSPKFACSGLPEGAKCMSARDIYEATNDGQVPLKMEGEEVQGEKKSKKTSKATKETEVEATVASGQGVTDTVIDNYVAPRLPDRPIPIRTPAQVMRIWVAPWEDNNGDLITNGYVYTEIEPRRWVIGQTGASAPTVLKPLQTISGSSKRNNKSE